MLVTRIVFSCLIYLKNRRKSLKNIHYLNNMNHKNKAKIARRLRTHEELKARVPIFLSAGWRKRAEDIRLRVLYNELKAQEISEKRKLLITS